MTVTTHIPTKLMNAQGNQTTAQAIKFGSDTFKIMAVKAGSGLPSMSSSGIQFVADVIATNPEDTLIGARQTLTTVTWTNDATLGQVDWSFASIVYAQAGGDDGLTRYFVIYDSTVGGTDATAPVVAIIDPGALVSVVAASLTIQAPTGGLISFTGGG
jgi:hypothetical protein